MPPNARCTRTLPRAIGVNVTLGGEIVADPTGFGINPAG
jgi:hypothetical protein